MKVRTSFVTNSSSSSYVVRYKVKFDDLSDFVTKIRDEFGKHGVKQVFTDINGLDDGLEFVSGRHVDIDYIFNELDCSLFESESAYEEW